MRFFSSESTKDIAHAVTITHGSIAVQISKMYMLHCYFLLADEHLLPFSNRKQNEIIKNTHPCTLLPDERIQP